MPPSPRPRRRWLRWILAHAPPVLALMGDRPGDRGGDQPQKVLSTFTPGFVTPPWASSGPASPLPRQRPAPAAAKPR